MSLDLPFEYSQRRIHLLRSVLPNPTKAQREVMDSIEEGDRELEDYLASLATATASAGGIGAVLSGSTGNISTWVSPWGFGSWPALTLTAAIGDTFTLNGQALIQTPGGQHKYTLSLSATGATVQTHNSPHWEGANQIQMAPPVFAIATATDTSVTFNMRLDAYDYSAKFIIGYLFGTKFDAA